jgi:hypothetical protein
MSRSAATGRISAARFRERRSDDPDRPRRIERILGGRPFRNFFDQVDAVIREVLIESEVDIRHEYGAGQE